MKFTILAGLVHKFEDKLNSIQNRISKYGHGYISYTKGEPYLKVDNRNIGTEVVDIDVEGQFKIEDYEFVASLEWNEETQSNIIKKDPETEDIPKEFRNRTACDHCRVDRFRKYTVLLKNTKTNQYVQVGKSCVKDYLGVDATDYAYYISLWTNLEQYCESLNKNHVKTYWENFFSVEEILQQTCAQVRRGGYISKAQVEKMYEQHEEDEELIAPQTTSRIIWGMMMHEERPNGELVYPKHKIEQVDIELFDKVVDFVENLEETSDYIRNLKTFIHTSMIKATNIGLVVSAVGFYLREINKKEQEQKAKLNTPKSKFVGNVGDKVEIKATPVCIFSTDSVYGTYHIYKFQVGDDEFIWKTTKCLEADVEISIKGTIKEHSTFKGIQQNELTRCRVI